MKTALFIQTDGTETPIEPDDGKVFTLDKLQELVGGYVEIIARKNGKIMLGDEDGRMKNLPINRMATDLLHSWLAPAPTVTLVGDILIVPDDTMRR